MDCAGPKPPPWLRAESRRFVSESGVTAVSGSPSRGNEPVCGRPNGGNMTSRMTVFESGHTDRGLGAAARRPAGRLRGGLGLALLLAAAPGASQESAGIEQALSIGAYAAHGDYGEDVRTRIRYVPLTYELNRGPWGLQLTLPWLRVTGLGNVLVNVGGVTRAVAGNEITTEQGIGDAVLTAIYRFEPWSATAPFLDVRLDVKLPTADEQRGLGTGEPDYSLELDLSQALGRTVLFGAVGYTLRGKSDLYVGLEDGAFAQLGLSYPLTPRVNAGLYYDFRERASVFSPESHELVPYFTWQLSDSWSVSGLATWGLTDASADAAVLGQLRYSW